MKGSIPTQDSFLSRRDESWRHSRPSPIGTNTSETADNVSGEERASAEELAESRKRKAGTVILH